MFTFLERVLQPTRLPEEPEPPARLVAFYWHFARQAKGLFAALFVDRPRGRAARRRSIPVFIGQHRDAGDGERARPAVRATPGTCSSPWRCWCWWRGRSLITAQNLVANQAIAANVTNLVRWQSHWHVVRQSWTFFQNDFAGRIANKVMQTGPAIRESLVSLITGGLVHPGVRHQRACCCSRAADRWLALPMLVWFAGYVGAAARFRAAHARPLARTSRKRARC